MKKNEKVKSSDRAQYQDLNNSNLASIFDPKILIPVPPEKSGVRGVPVHSASAVKSKADSKKRK
jgi:hypothetical protein